MLALGTVTVCAITTFPTPPLPCTPTHHHQSSPQYPALPHVAHLLISVKRQRLPQQCHHQCMAQCCGVNVGMGVVLEGVECSGALFTDRRRQHEKEEVLHPHNAGHQAKGWQCTQTQYSIDLCTATTLGRENGCQGHTYTPHINHAQELCMVQDLRLCVLPDCECAEAVGESWLPGGVLDNEHVFTAWVVWEWE
jgi:hypothetical protein